MNPATDANNNANNNEKKEGSNMNISALIPAITVNPYGEVLMNLRKEGGSKTVTAKIADAVCGCSIDEYRAPFYKVRALAVALDNAIDSRDSATIAAAEDNLCAVLSNLYNAAAGGLLPDRTDCKYCVLALNALRKGKDTQNLDGTTIKGTRDFRGVTDAAYVKAIENLIATRLLGQAWDENLNTFRAFTPEEVERMKKRVQRYHEKKAKKAGAANNPAPAVAALSKGKKTGGKKTGKKTNKKAA